MPALGLVIPFFNEERSARAVASETSDALRKSGLDYELVFVADGSTDRTVAELEAVATGDGRVRVVCGPQAEGYGAAILHGFSLLTADVVGWTDGDGQVTGQAVVDLYAAMLRDGATIGVGLRRERGDGRWRASLSRCYNLVMRGILGHHIADVNSKPKLIQRDVLRVIAPKSLDWFIDTEIVVGARVAGAHLVRLPVPFLARGQGASKVRLGIVAEYLHNLLAFRRRLKAELRQPSPAPGSASLASTAPEPADV